MARKRGAEGPAERASVATLGRLVADLGGGILDVVTAPSGLDVPIDQVTIHDPTSEVEIRAGDVVLAIGVDTRTAPELARRAAAAGAAAILTKLDVDPDGALATDAGSAIVRVAVEITWSQLHTLVRNAILGAGQSATGPGEVGTPVGDLFALANAVAAMVGGPTTIEDPQSRVLAYSSDDQSIDEGRRQTILGRKVPEPYLGWLQETGVFRRLWASDEVVRVDDIPETVGMAPVKPRLAIAVRAGDEILGSIWVAESTTPLGREAEAALVQASQIAALHLVRHRSGEAIERRMRAEMLRSLLEGRGPTVAIAERLDLDLKGVFHLLGFLVVASDDAELTIRRERAMDLITLYSEAFRRRSVLTSLGRTVYALVPTDDPERDDGVRRLAADIVARSQDALGTDVRVGISTAIADLRDAERGRTEVDQVLRVLAADAAGGVASFAEVRPEVLMLELRDHLAGRPNLLGGPAARLAELDGEDGHYVATLAALLDAFGDVPAAARAMGVHPNTFRYRLRRLEELADLDLSDPVQRLAIELELRLG